MDVKAERETGLLLAAAALTCGVIGTWLFQLRVAPVNTDAGYYVSHALWVARGDVPYRDFPSGYPPGSYYLLALLGENALRSPVVVKLVTCLAQLGNAALVYWILRRLGSTAGVSLLLAAVFGGLLTAAWGMAFELEAFVNLFVLASFACVMREPHPVRGAIAGLLLGYAVLIKQYALFGVPAVLMASLLPLDVASPRVRPTLRGASGRQLVALLLCAPVPYALFLVSTGLAPVENLVHLATFGGGASGYGTWGLTSLLETATEGELGRFLLPTFGLVLWLLWRAPGWRSSLLTCAWLLSIAPLLVRTYPYYLQLALPWSFFVMAEFARVEGARLPRPEAAKRGLALLLMLPLLGLAGVGLLRSFDPGITRQDQLELAARLEQEIDATEDVMILNGAWLYTVTRFVPPFKEYSFHVVGEDDPRRDRAQAAVVLSGRGSTRQRVEWFLASGMEAKTAFRWKDHTVYVLARSTSDGSP